MASKFTTKSVQTLKALKMFPLAISEATVGLSLSVYRRKALPERNMNMQKYFSNALLSLNPMRMKNMHFCPKGPVICKVLK